MILFYLYFDNKSLAWQAQCEDRLRYLGDGVMVCTWGCDVWLHRDCLSMDAQVAMLWARMFCSQVKTHVHGLPHKMENYIIGISQADVPVM